MENQESYNQTKHDARPIIHTSSRHQFPGENQPRSSSGLKFRYRSWATRANMGFFIFTIIAVLFAMNVIMGIVFLEQPEANCPIQCDLQTVATDRVMTALPAETSKEPPLGHIPRDATWQPVAGTVDKFYVYSAYVERRTAHAIRIIAVTRMRGPPPVLCRIWLPNESLVVGADIKRIKEHFGRVYSAVFVLCRTREANLTASNVVNASVSVVSVRDYTGLHTNLLPVLDTLPQQGVENEIHACVRPIVYSYGSVDWLIEWFEMSRILGISHFYMHSYSVTPNVNCLLNYYMRQGIVTLLPWNVPLTAESDLRLFGTHAAFNDCLYRSMRTVGWLVVIDIDELIFPRKKERTLKELLKAVQSEYAPSEAPASLLFRNVFFYRMWKDDKQAPYDLVIARKTRRWETPSPSKNRTKYAVRPTLAIEMGTHFPWELLPGENETEVDQERALLHHYRTECELRYKCTKNPSVIDRTAHKWAKELNMRVKNMYHSINKECEF